MKILIVNTNENEGGAAKAAKRLYKSLLNENIDVHYLVDNKSSDDYKILTLTSKFDKLKKKIRQQYDQLRVKFYKNRTGMIFSTNNTIFTSKLIDKINEINPDIVHLHWVNFGMINIKDLVKIKKPIVWTMHDSWLFTGGCHLPYSCEKFKNECGKCPVLGSNKKNDLSHQIFNLKKNIFSKVKLNVVAPSNWLGDNCKKSFLLNEMNMNVVPNPIDTDIFKPFDKEKARELWRLPKDKKLVLFGAMSGARDINKGFQKLSKAMTKMQKTDDVEFVVFGSSKPQNAPDFGFKTHYTGSLVDDVSLVTLYSAVNVMVVPSLQEAFGQTAVEAMACGVSTVAFGTTGLLDIIDHKINGYLAQPFDTSDLKDGIEWILNNKNYDEICINAREKVIKNFDSRVVAKRYISIYRELIK